MTLVRFLSTIESAMTDEWWEEFEIDVARDYLNRFSQQDWHDLANAARSLSSSHLVRLAQSMGAVYCSESFELLLRIANHSESLPALCALESLEDFDESWPWSHFDSATADNLLKAIANSSFTDSGKESAYEQLKLLKNRAKLA